MVGAIWRRVRSIFGGDATIAPTSRPAARRREVAEPVGALPRPPSDTTSGYVLAGPPAEPEPRPVEQLNESLTSRLVEDESLRGNLTDDEYQPLLDWALRRATELAESHAALPPRAAEARFNQTAGQLVELLRTIDLAVGGRSAVDPELTLSRFQMLDTLLTPPLLPGPVATAAQARLEALLSEPPERLQSEDGEALVRRLVDVLE